MQELQATLDDWLKNPGEEKRNAFMTELWTRYSIHFHLWALNYLKGKPALDPHDLNADFFEKKLLRIAPTKFQAKLKHYDSFDKWLWRVHRNWCHTWMKQQNRYQPDQGTNELLNKAGDQHSDQELLGEDLLKRITHILGPDSYQFQAWLLQYMGYSMKDIAERLDKNLESIRALLRRARKKLSINLSFDDTG